MPTSSFEAEQSAKQKGNWGPPEDQMMRAGVVDSGNGPALPPDDDRGVQDTANQEYSVSSSTKAVGVSDIRGDSFREKQVKPNKVYIGGLPEHTQPEDLQNCFGKIGNIVAIELKVGYGFVEFDSREAAEESVAKYHEGHFMGNKIRVELSRGGGRTAKYAGDPGACFKCGQLGHWARECPNQATVPSRRPYDPSLIDRIQRDYPPSVHRNLPPREEAGHSGRLSSRDVRYEYPPSRELRRPSSPRDYREYSSPPPPPPPGRRDYDDYRRTLPVSDRDRYPLPSTDYRTRYPPEATYRSYAAPPSTSAYYDRYERRPVERYPPSYVTPQAGRARTPSREFERATSGREYDFRGRPLSPGRYDEYSRIPSDTPPQARYKRRSESPSRLYDHSFHAPASFNNGYQSGTSASLSSAQRGGPPREFIAHRNGRESVESASYRRH